MPNKQSLLVMTNLPIKSFLSFCMLFFLMTDLQAQQSPWSIAVSAGASLPVGKFAGKNIYDSSQSLASLGLAVNLFVQYRLNSNFGVAVLIAGQENPIDNRSMARQLESNDSGAAVGVSGSSWEIGKLMGGPTLSLPIGSTGKWHLTSRIMAGALKTALPKSSITEDATFSFGPGGIPAIVESEYAHTQTDLPWSFAYMGSVGALYTINSRWSFRADIDYTRTTVQAPYNRHYASRSNISGVSFGAGITPVGASVPPPPYSLPIAAVNISVGIEVHL